MKKIGIILDSLTINKYLNDTIRDLLANNNIELYLLLNRDRDISNSERILEYFKKNSLYRFSQIVFFRLICLIEFQILKIFDKKINDLKVSFLLEKHIFVEKIILNPIFSKSGIIVKYPQKDIDKINDLNLDMILRGNARGIFRGDILKSSKHGIISFHHGDNRWNRGQPAGFWEVVFKKKYSGFIIQFLSSKLDSGKVIFRGETVTKSTYYKNQLNLYNYSNPFMSKIIIDYAEKNYLPIHENIIYDDVPILKSPNFKISINYFIYLCIYWVKNIFKL